MALVHELDECVGKLATLLETDVAPDTALTAWADERWRVKAVYTDDLVLAKEHPVIYVSATEQTRRVVAADAEYDVRMDVEILIEQAYREPTDETNAKRELTKLARRVEEVLRINRISEPFWYRSVFHDPDEPLKTTIYRLSVEQEVIIGAVLFWHGWRRVLLST